MAGFFRKPLYRGPGPNLFEGGGYPSSWPGVLNDCLHLNCNSNVWRPGKEARVCFKGGDQSRGGGLVEEYGGRGGRTHGICGPPSVGWGTPAGLLSQKGGARPGRIGMHACRVLQTAGARWIPPGMEFPRGPPVMGPNAPKSIRLNKERPKPGIACLREAFQMGRFPTATCCNATGERAR